MSDNELVILRVGQEFEADSAIGALGDAGIPAYKKAVPNSGILAFPGAYGLSENGFDVVIKPEDSEKAAGILVGIGCEPTVMPSDGTETAEDGEASTDDAVDEQAQPVEFSTGKRIFLGIIALLLIAGSVWLIDYIIAAVKGLLS